MSEKYFVMNPEGKAVRIHDWEKAIAQGVPVYDEYGNNVCDTSGLKEIGFYQTSLNLSECTFKVVDHEDTVLKEFKDYSDAFEYVNKLMSKTTEYTPGMYKIDAYKDKSYKQTIWQLNTRRVNI